jgi:hypothetical protein
LLSVDARLVFMWFALVLFVGSVSE